MGCSAQGQVRGARTLQHDASLPGGTGPALATTLAQLSNTQAKEARGAGVHLHVLMPREEGCLQIIKRILPSSAPAAHKATCEEQKEPWREAVFCTQFLIQAKGGKEDVPSPCHWDTLASSTSTSFSNFSHDYPTATNRTPCK